MNESSRTFVKGSLRIVVPALALIVGMPLLASTASDIAHRVDRYEILGDAYKSVSDDLRRGSLNLEVMRVNARTIRRASELQYNWFPAGSGPGNGVETAAKAEIWTNAVAFRAAQDRFASRAESFEDAVATGDVDTIRSASRLLGASCKGCHDDFRVERD
jgi:cytochrome c556